MTKKLTDKEKLTSNFYEPYVGCYAKRFYTPFEEKNLYKILGFRLKDVNEKLENKDPFFDAHFVVGYSVDGKAETWEWDVEDCVIITDAEEPIEDERVVDVKHEFYNGWNPYSGESVINEKAD